MSIHWIQFSFYLLLTVVTVGWLVLTSPEKLSLRELGLAGVTLVISSLGFYFVATCWGHNLILLTGFSMIILGISVLQLILVKLAVELEATIKFFVLGACFTVILGLGIMPPWNAIKMQMVVIVSLFLLGVFPFHFLLPDVALVFRTPLAFYYLVGSRLAGFWMLKTFTFGAVFRYPDFVLKPDFTIYLMCASLSLIYGTLVAIPQRKLKRLLGYTAVTSAGLFLLIHLAWAEEMRLFPQLDSFATVRSSFLMLTSVTGLFILPWVLAMFTVFYVLHILERQGVGGEIHELAGLWTRSRLISCALMLAALSLAGLPPLAGFFGQLGIWTALWPTPFVWLLGISLGAQLGLLYAFLGIIKVAFWSAPRQEGTLQLKPVQQILLYGLCFLLLAGGIWPGWVSWLTLLL